MFCCVATYIVDLSVMFDCNTSKILFCVNKILPSGVRRRVVCGHTTRRHTPEGIIADNHLHEALKFHWISPNHVYWK